jgi:hypothetical protein
MIVNDVFTIVGVWKMEDVLDILTTRWTSVGMLFPIY